MMLLVFFVFKQKTAYERRISDWSSDVCSSDRLQRLYDGLQNHFSLEKRYVRSDGNVVWAVVDVALVRYAGGAPDNYAVQVREIGRASCREQCVSTCRSRGWPNHDKKKNDARHHAPYSHIDAKPKRDRTR